MAKVRARSLEVDAQTRVNRKRESPAPKGLSKADLQLWAAFSQNITLLPGKTRLPMEPEPKPPQPAPSAPAIAPPKPSSFNRPVQIDQAPAGLDKSTWGQFAAGKIRAVRRLDLHGHTATRAHHAVTGFIERAYAEQDRCIEIITGKGEVLARELPFWLNAAPLRPLILAVAHPHAKNTGSVRILLRRHR
jgi:DNA-nicking Smr family endonuclease